MNKPDISYLSGLFVYLYLKQTNMAERILILFAVIVFFAVVPYVIGYYQNKKLKIFDTTYELWFIGFTQVATIISWIALFTVVSFLIMYGSDFKQHLQF